MTQHAAPMFGFGLYLLAILAATSIATGKLEPVAGGTPAVALAMASALWVDWRLRR